MQLSKLQLCKQINQCLHVKSPQLKLDRLFLSVQMWNKKALNKVKPGIPMFNWHFNATIKQGTGVKGTKAGSKKHNLKFKGEQYSGNRFKLCFIPHSSMWTLQTVVKKDDEGNRPCWVVPFNSLSMEEKGPNLRCEHLCWGLRTGSS